MTKRHLIVLTSHAQLGRYEHAGPWASFAVKDANLVTGQNPQSAGRVADLMIASLLN